MKLGKMFCTTLLAVICVTATAAVKIVPEPAEVIGRAGKSSIPSEITIAAPSGSNLPDTYIDLTSKILESKRDYAEERRMLLYCET